MTGAAPRLWLVRHAQPLIGAGICYGRLDVDADMQATHAAAQALHQALPAHCQVQHSPLRRCAQLAQALNGLRRSAPSAEDARLREMDFGQWEGQSWDAIGATAIGAWAADLARHAPGGGEPLAAMLERVDAALQQARAHAAKDGMDRVWITHAGVARCVQWLLAHGTQPPRSDQWTMPAPAQGQWLQVALPPA
ncbi:histidine phosphatase family protein [Delftia sp. PS-11]|uniref:histidine phosphatase family protein n=1 Tax=Delftia sp. PS-11 TaxID=2767222 RepID=UPI002458D261|nr:histidine phosphatase family protein [Delftia sp. PS-11]KAJ8740816.1 histidine phosphatase family protein [Delftia sp. PS-11]